MTKYQDLVICHKCDALAMAILDSWPLCSACLMSAVKTSGDPYLIKKIKPLPPDGHFEKDAAKLRGLIKMRDLSPMLRTKMRQTRSGPLS